MLAEGKSGFSGQADTQTPRSSIIFAWSEWLRTNKYTHTHTHTHTHKQVFKNNRFNSINRIKI